MEESCSSTNRHEKMSRGTMEVVNPDLIEKGNEFQSHSARRRHSYFAVPAIASSKGKGQDTIAINMTT